MSPKPDSGSAHLPPPPPVGPRPCRTESLGSRQGVPAPPSPTLFGPPPSGSGATDPARRDEHDTRNLVLGLGVASLVAVASSFVAFDWDAFDATIRASLLIGLTVASVVLGTMARSRRLAGTATALSWSTMVLVLIDLFAVQQAAFADSPSRVVTAVGGGVLFGLFLGLGNWQKSAAMKTGAAIAWMLAWWSAFAHWGSPVRMCGCFRWLR